jgi:hypothetical protein
MEPFGKCFALSAPCYGGANVGDFTQNMAIWDLKCLGTSFISILKITGQ